MSNDSRSTCLNGELRKGDVVLSDGSTNYPYLIGVVTEIIKGGLTEHETDNPSDDITVSFAEANYSLERIRGIERHFSRLYGANKTFGELPLDSVIIPVDALIRITGLEISKMNGLVKDFSQAQAFADSPELWPNERREYTLPEILEIMEPEYKAARELIWETIVGLQVFADETSRSQDTGAALNMIECLTDFWSVNPNIPTPDYLTDEQKLTTIRGLERHAMELLNVGGASNLNYVGEVQSLLDAIPAVWDNCGEPSKNSKERINLEMGNSVENLETMKLYSPLNFYLREREFADEGGYDEIEYWRDQITHEDAFRYMDKIELFLRRDREGTYGTERGLAEYLNETLDEKIFSIVPSIELHGYKLWCVAEIKLAEPLTPQDISKLKDWWRGQMSDGLGESWEQSEIKVNRGDELYIEPWTSGEGFFIATEREFAERFGLAAGYDEPQSAKTPMERLTEKLGSELAEYHAELMTKSKEDIIGLAFQAAAMRNAYFCLTEDKELTDAQIGALLEAPSPLRDVAEALRDSFSESMSMLDADTIIEAAHIFVPDAPDTDAPDSVTADTESEHGETPYGKTASGYNSVLELINRDKQEKRERPPELKGISKRDNKDEEL